jgi:hypothetical protein
MFPVSGLTTRAFQNFQASSTVRQTTVAEVEPTPNLVAQIIKSGAPKPHATVSNSMVAAVDSYTPPPGRNMAHYLTMDVAKAGNSVTSVVDALQRYLNVRPRREPMADPKDVASNDTFPTMIMDEVKAWSDNLPYQFSVNGVVQSQSQPNFYAQGGYLNVRIVGPGVSTVVTPATEGEPNVLFGPLATKGMYYPPAFAAQLAMSRISDMYNPANKMDVFTVGPENQRDVNTTLSEVAETLSAIGRGSELATPEGNLRAGILRFSTLTGYGRAPELFNTALAGRLG